MTNRNRQPTASDIRLVKAEREHHMGSRLMKVELEMVTPSQTPASGPDQLLNLALKYEAGSIRDDQLVAYARADFHRLCADLANATKDWALTDDEQSDLLTDAGKNLEQRRREAAELQRSFQQLKQQV
jgi:hypothetical protein